MRPFLTDAQVFQIKNLLEHKETFKDLENAEKQYQRIVQPQILADLIEFYSPDKLAQQKITYASFTPEGSGFGPDLGVGLHVVKRLTLPAGNGLTKIIDINEHWPEDRRSGGLFFPDEIRIKSLVFEGKRKVVGSEKLYLFDLLRLAWNERGEVKIARRTRYTFDPHTQVNHLKQMRSPVASPYSCISCHRSPNNRHRIFLSASETPNYEAIVQDRYFEKPISETLGFQEYLSHLSQSGRSRDFIEKIKRSLLNPSDSMRVFGLNEELTRVFETREIHWLPEDNPASPGEFPSDKQGFYRTDTGFWFVDAIESIFEGKYRWWEPVVVP